MLEVSGIFCYMIKIVETDNGFGVLDTNLAKFIIKDLKHNQAILFARDYQEQLRKEGVPLEKIPKERPRGIKYKNKY